MQRQICVADFRNKAFTYSVAGAGCRCPEHMLHQIWQCHPHQHVLLFSSPSPQTRLTLERACSDLRDDADISFVPRLERHAGAYSALRLGTNQNSLSGRVWSRGAKDLCIGQVLKVTGTTSASPRMVFGRNSLLLCSRWHSSQSTDGLLGSNTAAQ